MEVEMGDRDVAKLGSVGSTGRSTGPHLDWRINWQNKRLDRIDHGLKLPLACQAAEHQ